MCFLAVSYNFCISTVLILIENMCIALREARNFETDIIKFCHICILF